MQALVRGKFTKRSYLLMKSCAIVIQRAFRRFLKKKYYLIKLWRNYRKNIYVDEKLKMRELQQLSIDSIELSQQIKYYPETNCNLNQYFPQ